LSVEEEKMEVLISASPFNEYQKIYIYKDDVLISERKVEITDLYSNFLTIIKAYDVSTITLEGPTNYTSKLGQQIKDGALKDGNDVTITYYRRNL
jgi:hypothetical protein